MADDDSDEDRKKRFAQFTTFCRALGLALIAWQDVEREHFKLFLRMLGAPQWEVASAVYYSIESFESRHKMVCRMAYYFMKGEEYKSQRATWLNNEGGLRKDITEANKNRNKLAHYDLDFNVVSRIELPDGSVQVNLGPPSLQPVTNNLDAVMGPALSGQLMWLS